MHGIKETQELLDGVNELALIVIKHLKDGAQVEDVIKIAGELVASEKMKAALEGFDAVKDEVKDIDVKEAMELVVLQAQCVPKILEALKV